MQLVHEPNKPANLFETKNGPMPFYCHTKNSTSVSLQILTLFVAGI